MSKKLFTKFFVFLLVVGLLFAAVPTGQAQAATKWNWVAQTPTAPTQLDKVYVYIDADPVTDGSGTEVVGLEYHVGTDPENGFTKIAGVADTSVTGATHRFEIPAQPAGTYVSYQLFMWNQDGVEYGHTEFDWNYTVAAAPVLPVQNTSRGTYFNTIQAAIDDIATVAGDVIEVAAGTYAEQVTVNKPLTILGPNADKLGNATDRVPEAILIHPDGLPTWTTADPPAKILEHAIMTVASSDVTIKGLYFTSPDYLQSHMPTAIRPSGVAAVNNVTIENNYFYEVNNAIAGNGKSSLNWVIKGNKADGGVFVNSRVSHFVRFTTLQMDVLNNDVSNFFFGVYNNIYVTPEKLNGIGSTVSGNTFETSGVGIWSNDQAAASAKWVYTNNTFKISPTTTWVEVDDNHQFVHRPFYTGFDLDYKAFYMANNNSGAKYEFSNNIVNMACADPNRNDRVFIESDAPTARDTAMLGEFRFNKVTDYTIRSRYARLSQANLDTARNWWGTADGSVLFSQPGVDNLVPWCLNPECTQFSSTTLLNMSPVTAATTDTCNGTYEAYVNVVDVTDLAAYTLSLTYNANLVTVTKVENVGFTGGVAESGNSFADGTIKFGWSVMGGAGEPATLDGNKSLIKITFTAKGLAGAAAFAIDPVNSLLVHWDDVQPIPFEVTGGASVSFGSVVTNTSSVPQVSYCDLALAVTQAAGADTLRVDANITLPATVNVDKALTLDLNGKTVTFTTTDLSYALTVGTGGALIIDDLSTAETGLISVLDGDTDIDTDGRGIGVIGGSLTLNAGTIQAPYAGVYVRPGTSMEMNGGTIGGSVDPLYGIVILGTGSSLDINGGAIEATNFAVSGFGSAGWGDTTINIDGGALSSSSAAAIFHPQIGTLTISGGTITGTNGIEMEAGDLVITGGTIKGTGPCVTPVYTPDEDGSTDTGDAILILHQDGYSAGDIMNVTISGTPTIESTNCYALREVTLTDNSSLLGLATISGGHFTGGTPGAVSFSTNSATNLELVGGDYSANPAAFVYDPYFTYQSGSRWYIAIPPTITSTDIQGYYLSGEQRQFSVILDNPIGGADYAHVYVDFTMTNAQVEQISLIEYSVDNGTTWVALGTGPGTSFANVGTDIVGYFGKVDGGGFALAPNTTLTTLFRVTFVTRDAAVDLPTSYPVSMKLMNADALPTAYQLDDFAATMQVYDKPMISSEDIDGYYLVDSVVDNPQEFTVTMTNPVTGGNYSDVMVKITVLGAELADINAAEFWETAWAPSGGTVPGWYDVPFKPVGTDLVGWYGGIFYGGFPLANSGVAGNGLLRVDFAVAGNYTVKLELYTVTGIDSYGDDFDYSEETIRLLTSAEYVMVAKDDPEITATFPASPYAAGVAVTVPVTITNPGGITGPFALVLNLPPGTTFTFGGETYICGDDPATTDVVEVGCPPVVVTLPITASDLVITFPGAYTGTVVFNLYDTSLDPELLLATFTGPVVTVLGAFNVTGTVTMQGRLTTAGVPFMLTGPTEFAYGPYPATSIDLTISNYSFGAVAAQTYSFSTYQPRYLNIGNIEADVNGLTKTVTVDGVEALNPLRLRGGNAIWTDNLIDDLDLGKITSGYTAGITLHPDADVNFDNKINIQDLALVGGNYDLDSATAYSTWLP